MKTYVLMVSEFFPKNHKRAGEPTGFIQKIRHNKIHTLRGNYEFWKKRFNEIEKGNACLSIRVWIGKPYQSNQKEIYRYTNKDEIGLEKLVATNLGWFVDNYKISLEMVAEFDGLTVEDFKDWFKNNDFSKPIAIIHFTDFRYRN